MFTRTNALAIGIAVLLPLVVFYGVNTVFTPPDYADFISEAPPRPGAETGPRAPDAGAYQDAMADHARLLFRAALPIGLAAIIIGALRAPPGVAAGLILGGIATLTLGYARYWGALGDGFKFASLLAALAVLLGLGYSRWRKGGTDRPQ